MSQLGVPVSSIKPDLGKKGIKGLRDGRLEWLLARNERKRGESEKRQREKEKILVHKNVTSFYSKQ